MNKQMTLCVLLAGVFLFFAGCWNNVDSVQQTRPANSLVPFGPALEKAFTDCTWKSIPGEGKEKQVQFEGKISGGLHAFAIGELNTASKVTVLSEACTYLGALIKSGKAGSDPLITFDTGLYPITAEGVVKTEELGAYLDIPENRKTMLALEDFYRKRFWEQGSPVAIVFAVTGIKEGKVVRASNPHWDIDPKFAGKPENVMAMVYEYVKPLLTVE
ncbi:MAG: hypothetical protein ACYC9O_14540 [Candidatus Latescibacterota bacterium]